MWVFVVLAVFAVATVIALFRRTCVVGGISVWKRTVSDCRTKVTEPTLKTWRILLRSNPQAAIASLSSFEWKSRENVFRLPRLITFFWISATVLRLRVL